MVTRAAPRAPLKHQMPRSLKRWILPVAVLADPRTNSIQRGYFRREHALDVRSQLLPHRLAGSVAGLEHDESLGLIRRSSSSIADHRRLEHRLVGDQRRLDLDRRHVDAAHLEHAVAAPGDAVAPSRLR